MHMESSITVCPAENPLEGVRSASSKETKGRLDLKFLSESGGATCPLQRVLPCFVKGTSSRKSKKINRNVSLETFRLEPRVWKLLERVLFTLILETLHKVGSAKMNYEMVSPPPPPSPE